MGTRYQDIYPSSPLLDSAAIARPSAADLLTLEYFEAENFTKTITVEERAHVAALSPSHFSRLFKQTIGKSPMNFVTAYRVEQAKKRLSLLG